MKTKFSIKTIILIIFALVFIIFLLSNGILFLIQSIKNQELLGFIISYVFIWLSLGVFFGIQVEVFSLEIRQDKKLIVKNFISQEKVYHINEMKIGFLNQKSSSKAKNTSDIVIQTKTKETYVLFFANYKNLIEVYKNLSYLCEVDNSIKPKYNYKKIKLFSSMGLMLLVLIAIQLIIS